MTEQQQEESDQLNLEVLRLNKKCMEENTRILLQNEEYGKEEHSRKMELFYLQRQELVSRVHKKIEPSALSSVREFHTLMNQPVLLTPTIPGEDRTSLRVKLLQEELNELSDAIKNGDLVEIADALGDLQYILSGTVHEFGLGSKFKDVFDEIHRSNMSKACTSETEAQDSCIYWGEQGQLSHYEERAGKYVIYRDIDKKVLKSINYSPASLAKIVQG